MQTAVSAVAAAESEDSAVADFLMLLEKHKKKCEEAGKYIEADIAKKRLNELRQHEDARREENLRSRQVAQRLGIEEAHMLEFQQFNAQWDRTMKEYEERAAELLEAMRQRHEIDTQTLRQRAAEGVSRIKRSPKLLDLRKIEQRLAKQGEYAEAHHVKLRADALEAEEREKALVEREAQLAKAETTLMHRQDQEVNALRQRIQTGAEEQRVARQQDLERLLRRYHNTKNELETQQTAERQRQRRGVDALPGALGQTSLSRNTSCNLSGSSGMGLAERPSSARKATPRQATRPGVRPVSARGTPPSAMMVNLS